MSDPSGVGVKGETGGGEVNQESLRPGAVAETETGRSRSVTRRTWDRKGEGLSECPPGTEWSKPTPEAECSSEVDGSETEDEACNQEGDTDGSREQPQMVSTSLANGNPSPLISDRKDSIVLPVAYLDSSNPPETDRDRPGVVLENVKSLERRTEGWRVSGGSQEDSMVVPGGSGIVWRGGVRLNPEGFPEETDPDAKSPRLSRPSKPTPGEMGSVSQPDRGCEG